MLTAHMIVKNEERWVWFSILSIINHVEKLLIFDTGSKDKTRDILRLVKLRYPEKINLMFFDDFPERKIGFLRQLQIEMTETEWFMIIDGDEIWPQKNIKIVLELLASTNASLVAVPFVNFVGNLNYIQNPLVNTYRIKNISGSITLRFIKTHFNGVHAQGEYGVEGYYSGNGHSIQSFEDDLVIVDAGFQHTSLLIRSKNIIFDFMIRYRRKKFLAKSWRLRDFDLAEVITADDLPAIVPNPYQHPNWLMRLWYTYYSGVKW